MGTANGATESLFKLFVIRPAPPAADDDPSKSLSLAQDTPFQRGLRDIAHDNADGEAKIKARQYAKDDSLFLRRESDVPHATELRKFALQLDALTERAKLRESKSAKGGNSGPQADNGDVDSESEDEDDGDESVSSEISGPIDVRTEVIKIVREVFGVRRIEDILSKIQDAVPRLKDSIIVIKRLPEEHHRPIEVFSRQLLDIDFLKHITDDKNFPESVADMETYRNRPLRIPSVLELDTIRRNAQSMAKARLIDMKAAAEKLKSMATKLNDRYKVLDLAIQELRTKAPEHLVDPPRPQSIPAIEAPKEFLPEKLALRRLELLESITSTNHKMFNAALSLAQKSPESSIDPMRILDAAGSSSAVQLADMVLKEHQAISPVRDRLAWKPSVRRELPVLFKESLLENVSSSTRNLISKNQIPVMTQQLDRTISTLNSKIEDIKKEFNALPGSQPESISLTRVGNQSVIVRKPNPPLSLQLGPDFEWTVPILHHPLDNILALLAGMGRIKPSGEADLLVVKQQLVRYEGGDVAHVENILKGETNKRETTVKNVTETYSFLETENTEEKGRENDSTERFEVSREAQDQIQKESAAQASATVTGSYGPCVSFSASIVGQKKDAQQSAVTTASKTAKDIVEKSTEKITNRILERTAKTITSTISETNTHEINNSFKNRPDGQHIAGVYQWVNKVYQARVHNYGLRKMYDFMIPEPAAFYIFSKVNRKVDTSAISSLTIPPELTDTPSTITEQNSQGLAIHYGVDPTTLPPYPPTFTWVNKGAKGSIPKGQDGSCDIVDVTIPDGYQCIQLHITYVDQLTSQVATFSFGYDSTKLVGLELPLPPSGQFGRNDTWVNVYPPVEGVASLTISVQASQFRDYEKPFAWQVGFVCQATGAVVAWQNKVWKQFKTAVDLAKANYDAKLRELQTNALASSSLVQIEGTNPADNLVTIRDELKRNCISLMTNSKFESFDAIFTPQVQPVSKDDSSPDPSSFPSIDIPTSFDEGSIVLFFEQAFEWMNMTYTLYPYFWARKSTWLDRIQYDDPDPLFNRFLKAGYARVTLPVRPGFASAIAHYLDFGEPWMGGPLPPIGSDMYLSVAEETMEETGKPQKEYGPPSDPWDVVVPTTLVKLRPDDELPRWAEKKNANGESDWVELVKKNGQWEEIKEVLPTLGP